MCWEKKTNIKTKKTQTIYITVTGATVLGGEPHK